MTGHIIKALQCLYLSRETVAGWVRDESGRVHIHPDVINKAINAAILELEGSQRDKRKDAEQFVSELHEIFVNGDSGENEAVNHAIVWKYGSYDSPQVPWWKFWIHQ